jgi:hypothetical protein
MKKKFLVFVLFICFSSLYSQEMRDTLSFTPQFKYGLKYNLKTKSGITFTGFVVNETKETVTLENRRTYEKTEIKKSDLEVATQYKQKNTSPQEEFETNHHATNYLLSSSAFLFEQGVATSNSHWFLIQSFDYALSENFAVTSNCLAFYPISLGIKSAIQIADNNYIGASVFGMGNIFGGVGNTGPLLWGYGAIAKYTNGTSNKNFSVSGGLLGLRSDIFLGRSSVNLVNLGFLNVAYCNRLRENIALNLEGWYFPEAETALAGVGVKFIGNERNCWTLGCFSFLNNLNNKLTLNFKTLPIPYFGICRRF